MIILDGQSTVTEAQHTSETLFIFSLAIAFLIPAQSSLVLGLMLLDIGLEFGVSVGVMGQVQTISSIVATLNALLWGFSLSNINIKLSFLQASSSFAYPP